MLVWIQYGVWYDKNVDNILMFSVVAKKLRTSASHVLLVCRCTRSWKWVQSKQWIQTGQWNIPYHTAYCSVYRWGLTGKLRLFWDCGYRIFSPLELLARNKLGIGQRVVSNCTVHHSFLYSISAITLIIFYLISVIKLLLSQPTSLLTFTPSLLSTIPPAQGNTSKQLLTSLKYNRTTLFLKLLATNSLFPSRIKHSSHRYSTNGRYQPKKFRPSLVQADDKHTWHKDVFDNTWTVTVTSLMESGFFISFPLNGHGIAPERASSWQEPWRTSNRKEVG